jgi:membrane protein implicated in regulation of membrane protease activity
MDWNAATLWWVVAGVLVAAELASGTFYLLMLALGAAAAALAAHLHLPLTGQLVAAALMGGGAVALWHVRRQRGPASAPVERWDAQGQARVHHRGADWAARYGGSGTPAPGTHVIRAIEGSELLLERAPG